MKLTPQQFSELWPTALDVLRRAIDRGPPLQPADRADLEQTLALRIVRAADSSKTTNEYQWRAYVKRVANSVRLDFFRPRTRTQRIVARTSAEVRTDPQSRRDEALEAQVVREVLERFPGEHFAAAVQPPMIREVLPVPAQIRTQRFRARKKLAAVIPLITGYKRVNRT